MGVLLIEEKREELFVDDESPAYEKIIFSLRICICVYASQNFALFLEKHEKLKKCTLLEGLL